MPIAELSDAPLFSFIDSYSPDQIEYLEAVPVRNVFPKGRLKNVLPHEGYETIWDILQLTERDFGTIRHIGKKSRLELVSNTMYWLRNNDILPEGVDVNLEIKRMPEINREITYVETEEVFPFPDKYAGVETELLQASIGQIPYSGRVEKALKDMNVQTVKQVLDLKWSQFEGMRGFGVKSKDDLVWKTEQWIKAHQNPNKEQHRENTIEAADHYRMDQLAELISSVCEELSIHQIKIILARENKRIDLNGSTEKVLRELLCGKSFNYSLSLFFEKHITDGICTTDEFDRLLQSCTIFIRYPELKDVFFITGVLRMKSQYVFSYRMDLDEYLNYLSNHEGNKSIDIFLDEMSGLSTADLMQKYGCSRQNIHLHLNNIIAKAPLLYEDYYADAYPISGVNQESFQKAFPDVTDAGYEYLGLRYGKNETKYQKKTPINEYRGRFAPALRKSLKEEKSSLLKRLR